MTVKHEFSKYAQHYGQYNIIQTQVVRKLLDDLQYEPRNVLDLGCGNGSLYRAVDWPLKHFVGVDFSKEMLQLHPKAENVSCLLGDFNDPELFERLRAEKFDRIFSSSALQWAVDLERVFSSIRALETPVSLAIFTANTFKTLFETAGLPPLLRSAEEVVALAKKSFDAECEVVTYSLSFDSVREMFRYIKRSGVSGARRALDYRQTKKLMESYPLDYLEFEVVFIRN
jgi:malonyl-CoA O-methyltransferase